MAWLVAHMWMVLAGATVFALLLGWSVRGILLTGKMRKAIVDKDVALTELDQARDEIERLFAAQRAQRGEGGHVADASARKISDLTTELQKAKTELATLKAGASRQAAPAAAAPEGGADTPTIVLPPNRGGAEEATGSSEDTQAAQPAAGGDEPEAPTLVWRNRHLEARVQHLESQLAERAAAPVAPVVAAATPETGIAAEPSPDQAGLEKLKWQADYLKQRVEALEAELAKAPAEAPAMAGEDLNEEMARLRWRNRFLEGRLAYFEGGAEDVAAETTAGPEGAEAVLEAVEAMAEDVSAAEALAEDEAEFVSGETDVADEEEQALAEAFGADTAGSEEDSFEDVSDDEEESLAEADHADEDVLSDEEYDEEDFVEEDESGEAFEAGAEDADEYDEESEDFDDSETDEQDESYDEDSDEEVDEADDDDDEDVEDDLEDDAEDEDFDDEEFDESEDEYEAGADDEESSAEDEDAWDEADEVEDDAEDDGEYEDDDEELDDEESGDDVTYESEGTVLTERPMAMNGPVEGRPDDLTLIGGIGPKIQVLLNELGVWHYDQIAEWTPENVAWIDEHLNFNGRIAREGWVEQAAVLVRDAENA